MSSSGNGSDNFEHDHAYSSSSYSASSVDGYTPTAYDGLEKAERGEGERRTIACAVPYDLASGCVLLISSRKKHGRWTLPKGGTEDGEELSAAVMREAWEEGGILGYVEEEICSIATDKNDVHFFALQVSSLESEWPEEEREREWVTVEDAIVRVGWRPEQASALQYWVSTRSPPSGSESNGETAGDAEGSGTDPNLAGEVD